MRAQRLFHAAGIGVALVGLASVQPALHAQLKKPAALQMRMSINGSAIEARVPPGGSADVTFTIPAEAGPNGFAADGLILRFSRSPFTTMCPADPRGAGEIPTRDSSPLLTSVVKTRVLSLGDPFSYDWGATYYVMGCFWNKERGYTGDWTNTVALHLDPVPADFFGGDIATGDIQALANGRILISARKVTGNSYTGSLPYKVAVDQYTNVVEEGALRPVAGGWVGVTEYRLPPGAWHSVWVDVLQNPAYPGSNNRNDGWLLHLARGNPQPLPPGQILGVQMARGDNDWVILDVRYTATRDERGEGFTTLRITPHDKSGRLDLDDPRSPRCHLYGRLNESFNGGGRVPVGVNQVARFGCAVPAAAGVVPSEGAPETTHFVVRMPLSRVEDAQIEWPYSKRWFTPVISPTYTGPRPVPDLAVTRISAIKMRTFSSIEVHVATQNVATVRSPIAPVRVQALLRSTRRVAVAQLPCGFPLESTPASLPSLLPGEPYDLVVRLVCAGFDTVDLRGSLALDGTLDPGNAVAEASETNNTIRRNIEDVMRPPGIVSAIRR